MFKRLTFLLVLFAIAGTAMAQKDEQEANLKAVFIYNFTRYVDWDAGSNAENDFIIGVIGNSAVERSIAEIARINTVNNKKIVIRHFNKPEEIGPCHILFIAGNNNFSLQSILDNTPKGALTVSERPGAARQGTSFNFVLLNDKLKFEANLKAISAAGLKASSQLLKLAIIVNN